MSPSNEPREPLPDHTAPPGRYVVLYDGACRFCSAAAQRLAALARPGAVEMVNFQAPGALDRFPGVSHAACMQAMHLVTPDGRLYRGAEAGVRALATRWFPGWFAYVYYLPGLRQLFDRLYAFVAAHRYRLMGKTAAGECDGGTCALHAPMPPTQSVGPGLPKR
jgi:predicted DCC family thiol-disulfide oxidoreductase YuxK